MALSSLSGKGLLLLAGAAAILASARSAAADETYVVIAGDTACEIAEQFSIPCAALIEANRLGKDALIFVGQRLALPGIGQPTGTQVDEPPAEPETIPPTQVDEPLESEEELAEEGSSSKTDLWSVYLLARAHDPRFAAQRLRRDAAQQALPQARAALRPQLSFSSSLGRSYDDDLEHSDSLQSSVSLNQSLYNRSSSLAVQQARYRIAAAEADYREAEQDLILRVAQAYFAVLAMTDNLELSERNQAAIGRQLELALERLTAGLGTRTDLFDAEARYESAVADGIQAAKLLDDAGQGLMLLTSSNPGALRTVHSAAQLTSPEPNEPGVWIDTALKYNHRLVAEKHNLSVTQLAVARQQVEAGANLIDINFDEALLDGVESMRHFLNLVPQPSIVSCLHSTHELHFPRVAIMTPHTCAKLNFPESWMKSQMPRTCFINRKLSAMYSGLLACSNSNRLTMIHNAYRI